MTETEAEAKIGEGTRTRLDDLNMALEENAPRDP